MSKKEIKVKLNTITPLWTGDAWQENRKIRPSSLMGSLRFWFEVICYFSGICNKKDLNNGRFEKEVDRKNFRNCLVDKGNSFEAKIKCLIDQGIPYPSIIFGTTNWKSLIKIIEIEYLDDYCFGNKLNLPYAIGIKKEHPENIEEFSNREDWENKINSYEGRNFKEKLRKAKEEFSFFFFNNPYFYGNIQVKFEIEEEIVESIFYPLLTFMDKYGFWGGKWNIGYGRLEVLEVKEKEEKKENDNSISNWRKTDFETFDGICFSWESLVSTFRMDINSRHYEFIKKFLNLNTDRFHYKTERDFKRKIGNIPKSLIFVETISSENNDYESIIKSLLRKKLNIRNCLRPDRNNRLWKTFRHRLLGEQGEGSKIPPFIGNNNKFGFLSIAGLLNLEGENNG